MREKLGAIFRMPASKGFLPSALGDHEHCHEEEEALDEPDDDVSSTGGTNAQFLQMVSQEAVGGKSEPSKE